MAIELLQKINPFHKVHVSQDSSIQRAIKSKLLNGISLPSALEKDTVSLSNSPQKGIIGTIKGFFSNIRETAAKKAAQVAEAAREKKALDSDLGQLLKGKTYERDWGDSYYGGSTIERLYSDKSIVAIVEMNEKNPKKAMTLMETLKNTKPGLSFSEVASIQKEDPEIFSALIKTGKVNGEQFAALSSVKVINPDVANGLSISSIKTLDTVAGKSKESLDAVNKMMQNETLSGVLAHDVPADDVNKYVANMVETPELTTQFSKMFEYDMEYGERKAGNLKKVNDLIDTYKRAPGRIGAYINGFGIKEPNTLRCLFHLEKSGLPVMQLLEERSHCSGLVNAAEYVYFRTDKRNAVILENILKTENKEHKADKIYRIIKSVESRKEQGLDIESALTRMAEDKRKPQTVQEFDRLADIYLRYPQEKISTEFIDYYTKNEELAKHIDLMAAFKG